MLIQTTKNTVQPSKKVSTELNEKMAEVQKEIDLENVVTATVFSESIHVTVLVQTWFSEFAQIHLQFLHYKTDRNFEHIYRKCTKV